MKSIKEIRYCDDIGMWALDRSPMVSCVNATAHCREHCYNNKLYKLYPAMNCRDIKNELAWKKLNGDNFAATMKNKRKGQKDRFRFCTRGDTFASESDIYKVEQILQGNPNITFWIPTRAWRNPRLRDLIELRLMPLDNARILASLDPSNDFWEKRQIINRGWSTMFFGDDAATDGRIKCQKTWKTSNVSCDKCNVGCFEARYGYKQVQVHLKSH